MTNKVRTLDLFSGIGGITYALHDFCKPVLYCDTERFCQQVLYERMVDQRLPSAPIHSDIRTLRLCGDGPEMIVGGFPCTDVSAIGLQKGITNDTRSGLFLQIMRLVDENPCIKVLFLENVSNIVRCGLKDVIDELCKRGFSFAWSHKSAGSLGAPHVRSRWFCLAHRGDVDVGKMFPIDNEIQATVETANIWQTEPSRRHTFKPVSGIEDDSYDDNWVLRCQTLGNTVCPVVVRAAFVELVRLVRNSSTITDIFRDFGSIDVNRLRYPYPETGLVTGNRFFSMPSMNLSIIPKSPDSNNTPDEQSKIHITLNMSDGKKLTPVHYPTPRRGIAYASSLTERSTRDLPSVLLHSEEALEAMSREMSEAVGHDVPRPDKPQAIAIQNVNYVEWMMGYPADWTRVNMYEKGYQRTTTKNDDDGGDGGCDAMNDDDDAEERDDAEDVPDTGRRKKRSRSTSTQQPYKLNGMHVLMREFKGLDIKAVSEKWRSLTPDQRQQYSNRAREISADPILRYARPSEKDDPVSV
jgi:DNA (cytosine-5)-methyltransferase 1